MSEHNDPDILSKTERNEILWRTIRTDFVENGVDLRELHVKYKVGRTAVYTRAKRGNWRDLRKAFVQSPEDENELSVAERRDRLIKWLRTTAESLHVRALQLINDEADRATLAKDDTNRFVDSVEKVKERTSMMRDLDGLRKAAFGEIIEVIEHDMIYEVVVEEQKPRVRIVKRGEVTPEQPIIDIPAEEIEELGLVISPKHIVPPKNGGPNGEEP